MPRFKIARSGGPFFSIIMTSKNDAEMLENMFRQLEQQTFQDFELIIVPAARSDYQVAKRHGDKVIPRFSQTNKRDVHEISKAYNEAIKFATGEYIMLIDVDLKFKDNQQLERIADYIKNTGYAIYSCNIKQYNPKDRGGTINYITRKFYPMLLQLHIIKRSVIEKEFADYEVCPHVWIWDYRLSYRLIARGYNIHLIDETLYHLRKYNNTTVQNVVGFFK